MTEQETAEVPVGPLEYVMGSVESDVMDWYDPAEAKEAAQQLVELYEALGKPAAADRMREYAEAEPKL